jgi:hypothetical protein
MVVPNGGPELPDPSDEHVQDRTRRGNPSLVFRDQSPAGDVDTAPTRGNSVTQRFGGHRYAMSRPASASIFETFQRRPFWPWQPTMDIPMDPGDDGGESDQND